MLTRESVIEKVSRFAAELKALGIHLKKVILYGSYASNRQHEWSDIDVALVADEFTGFGFEDCKYFSRINIRDEYLDIETRTFSTADFEKGNPFIEEIKKTGVEIKI
jgi:predicted nucleotidyltransferase